MIDRLTPVPQGWFHWSHCYGPRFPTYHGVSGLFIASHPLCRAMKALWKGWGPARLDILPLPTFMQYFLLVLLACPSPLGAPPPALHTCQGLAPCLPEEGQVNTSGPRLLLATLHPASSSFAAMDRTSSALLLSLLLLQTYGVCGAPHQPRGKWGAQRRDAWCQPSTSLLPACWGTGKEVKEE